MRILINPTARKEMVAKPSDTLRAAADTVEDVTTSGYAVYKDIVVGVDGVIKTTFDMSAGEAGGPTYGRVFVNGYAASDEHSTTTYGYTTYTDYIHVYAGDRVQLGARENQDNAPYTGWVKNFRIYYDIDTYYVIND